MKKPISVTSVVTFTESVLAKSDEKTAIMHFLDWDDFKINYIGLEELSKKIFDRLFEMVLPMADESVTIEYEPDKIVSWNFVLAHYCFSHGRLSESDFVKMIFFKEEVGS